MATQKNKVNPLDYKAPIANKDGTPTPEFMRKWAQQASSNGAVPADITTAAQVSAILDLLGMAEGDIIFRSSTAWAVLTAGTAGYVLKTGGPSSAPVWESVSALLDGLGAVQGDTLYRDATGWNVLAPPTGHPGYVLTWDDTTGLPKWAAGGSGGGVTIGTGAPAFLAPAGTPYSRDDVAGLYVSTSSTSDSWTLVGPSTGGSSPDFLVPLAADFPTHGNAPVMADTPVGLGIISPGNGSVSLYWAARAQANVNFTILARVTQNILTDFTGEVGVFLRNSSSGKFLTAVISQHISVKFSTWNSDTSKNGDVATITTAIYATCWIKVTYNATSNLTSCYFSRDGANWNAVGTDSTFVGIPDQVGVCVDGQSGLGCPTGGTIHYWSVT